MPRTKTTWPAVRRSLVRLGESLDPDMRIRVRDNYTCCGTCGHHAMQDDCDGSYRHYFFWHAQEEEEMEEGGTLLHLQHGMISTTTESYLDQHVRHSAAVEYFVGVLRQHGFDASWDGDLYSAVEIDLASTTSAREH